ncbi:MAG: hypothetical protein BWX79_02369 [Alphaproteobacteria bacterium ADurb.Bin100]|nr:MAG: hypothetical protein BWX79_02369 [Alphaproteobacteria bacterium ADurb.Bin100]
MLTRRGPGACRFCAVHLQRNGAALGKAQRRLEALGQALAQLVEGGAGIGGGLGIRGGGVRRAGADLDTVDHHVDVVLFRLLQLGQVVDFIGHATDAKAHIALRLHVGEQLQKLALLLARHGRQDHEPCALWQCQRGVHHLAHGLGLQWHAVVRAVGRAGAGEQQAQVIVDLGHRAHGGARVVAGGLLFDGDRRGESLDQVHVGLVHQLQELPCVGGKALHIAALALGVERVERQAGLARSRQPGDHHQLVARDVKVDVLQVVGARPPHTDALLAQHGGQVAVVRAWHHRQGVVVKGMRAVGGGVQGGRVRENPPLSGLAGFPAGTRYTGATGKPPESRCVIGDNRRFSTCPADRSPACLNLLLPRLPPARRPPR